MPKVTRIDLPSAANMGVAVEGSALAWPGALGEPTLPQFDEFNDQHFYVDVFNRGKTPFAFTVAPSVPWIVVNESRGSVDQEKRLWVSVDWRAAPAGSASGVLKISSNSGQVVSVKVLAFHPERHAKDTIDGFVEGNGYVSIEAIHYTNKIDTPSARWEKIDDLGRTLSAMTLFPVTAPSVSPPQSPRLEYKLYLFDAGPVEVEAILDPTLNFVPGRGLRYAISFDDETPQIVDMLEHHSREDWATSVKDEVRKVKTNFTIARPGYHTLKFWMVDPGVVLQKLVVNLGGVQPSYLGPPESHRSAAPQ
jgi:hypothetical protein